MSSEPRLEQLEGRLETVERRYRRLLRGVVLVIVVAGVVLAGTASGAGGPTDARVIEADTVVASRFVVGVEDGDSTARYGRLEATSGQEGVLYLHDENGDMRVALAGEGDLQLHGPEESDFNVTMSANFMGPSLQFWDEGGRRIQLGSLAGLPSLSLYDEHGQLRADLGGRWTRTDDGVISYPVSSLHLFGSEGQLLWSAP